MKKFLAMFLCLVMVISCVSVLASCDKDDTKESDKTNATTQSATDPADTTAATEATTTEPEVTTAEPEVTTAEAEVTTAGDESAADDETTVADETNADDETTVAGDAEDTSEAEDDDFGDYVPTEDDVIIRSAEDLMALNKLINEDSDILDSVNVVFTADIDLSDYEWVPLYGDALYNVTFVGNGHTISNMTINYNVNGENTTPDYNLIDELLAGAGFVGVATHEIFFKNLTFDNCYIKAYERYVGCVVGRNFGGIVEMENVKVTNFKVEGWYDLDNRTNEDGAAINIAQRVGGIMGSSHGQSYFENCHVENIELTGYQNLAGIVGFDQAGSLDEYSFVDCSVKSMKLKFGYGFKKDVNDPMKLVTVFCNFSGYVNKTDYLAEMGNIFEGVSYYDIANDTEYLPGDFVTPPAEETPAA